MLSLATLPSPVRALYNRQSVAIKKKIEGRVIAIAALSQAARSAWESEAQRLSAALAPRYGTGFSVKSILSLYRKFRKEGPVAIIPDYGRDSDMPAEFVQELTRRVEKNKRVASVELRAIIADWMAGEAIPGYGTWRDRWQAEQGAADMPAACPDWFRPPGWSDRNLRRRLPGNATLELARNGHFAAHGLLPQKQNDYRELLPLQMIVFDDVRMDWLVSYPGITKACELWLLVAMDAATRCILDWVSLAAVPDDEGKRAELLEQHMQILGGSILQRYGIPQNYPMTLKVENAKATFRESTVASLKALSGGQIVVEHTAMHTRALASGFTERHGTPWDIKGILESFFGNLHNHTAALPGHTGARYDLAPAELESRKKEHEALMKEAADLPAEVTAKFRQVFLPYSEAVDTLTRVFHHLNNRRNHQLKGFDKIDLFRFPEDHTWRSIEELRRYPRAEVARAIFESRMETPAERMEKLMRKAGPTTPVPAEALVEFMGRTIKRVRHPAPYTIAFKDAGVEHVFRAEIPQLASGKGGPFFVKLLPSDVATAYLYAEETGAMLGILRRVNAALIGHEEAQMAAVGEVQHFRSLIEKPILERHADERAQKQANTELNAALIAAARTGQAMIEGAAEARSETKRQTAAQLRKNQDRAAQLAARARAQAGEVSSL
jgi:hypothetical protein